MAVSAQLENAPWADNRLWCRKKLTVTLDGSGDGSTTVNLDTTFRNTPKMLVVPPPGSAGVYAAVYDSATPKIDVGTDISGGTSESVTGLLSTVVEVVLLAMDQD